MAEFLADPGCRRLLPPSRERDNLCFGAILLPCTGGPIGLVSLGRPDW